jgi:uncharacterized protein YhbP (UPF0306 family)
MSDKFTSEMLTVMQLGQDMTLATLLPDGAPHAVVVSYASEGTRLYFGCDPGSCKARNLARDPRVAATITLPYGDWSQIRGLSMLGRCRLLAAGEADAAKLSFLRKFNELAQYVAEPASIALFEVAIEKVSLLDYRKGFGWVAHGRASPERAGAIEWGDQGQAG